METLDMNINESYFKLGEIRATFGVTKELSYEQIKALITQHAELEPGELEDSDFVRNLDAIRHNDTLFSCYQLEGKRYYVITEGNRSVTTILKPEEY